MPDTTSTKGYSSDYDPSDPYKKHIGYEGRDHTPFWARAVIGAAIGAMSSDPDGKFVRDPSGKHWSKADIYSAYGMAREEVGFKPEMVKKLSLLALFASLGARNLFGMEIPSNIQKAATVFSPAYRSESGYDPSKLRSEFASLEEDYDLLTSEGESAVLKAIDKGYFNLNKLENLYRSKYSLYKGDRL